MSRQVNSFFPFLGWKKTVSPKYSRKLTESYSNVVLLLSRYTEFWSSTSLRVSPQLPWIPSMTSACLQGWRPPESWISQLIKHMKTSFVSSKFDTWNRTKSIWWPELEPIFPSSATRCRQSWWASFDINNSNMQSQSHSYKRSRSLHVLKQLVKGRKGCWELFSLVALSSWWCSPCSWQQDNMLVSNTRSFTWKSQACSECFDPTVCSRTRFTCPLAELAEAPEHNEDRSYGPGGRRRSLSARWPSHWRDIWLLFTLYNNPKHNSWNFKLPLWWVFTFM